MKKQRRSVRQWIADKLHIQTTLDAAERKSLVDAGIRIGIALITGKPEHQSSWHDYAGTISEQVSGAMERLKSERTHDLARALPPQPPAPAVQILPADSLRRMIGTSHLPAVRTPGAVFEKHLDTTGKHRTKSLRDIAAANAFQASTTRPVRLTDEQQRAYDAYEQQRIAAQHKRASGA